MSSLATTLSLLKILQQLSHSNVTTLDIKPHAYSSLPNQIYIHIHYCRLERPIRDRYTDKLRKSIHDLKQQVLRHETDVQKTRQVKTSQ